MGTRVRTTITPGIVIEVGDAELLDFERQGLIHSREGEEGFIDDEPVEAESGVITDTNAAIVEHHGEQYIGELPPDAIVEPTDADPKGHGKKGAKS